MWDSCDGSTRVRPAPSPPVDGPPLRSRSLARRRSTTGISSLIGATTSYGTPDVVMRLWLENWTTPTLRFPAVVWLSCFWCRSWMKSAAAFFSWAHPPLPMEPLPSRDITIRIGPLYVPPDTTQG